MYYQRIGVFCLLIAWQFSALAEEPKPGDLRDSGTIAMKLCYCPSGKFLMGSPQGTNNIPSSDGHDKRQWEVTLSEDFWIGQTEVTQKQWSEVMKSEPWKASADKRTPVGESLPAVCISWHDAMAFCEALTKQERSAKKLTDQEEYRLPTESEWEYTCRAGTKAEYFFDDKKEVLADYAWFSVNAEMRVQPVAQKKPNPWGLYDICGNAGEWCSDWYVDFPAGGKDPQGPLASPRQDKVFRGGLVVHDSIAFRSAMRFNLKPDLIVRFIGFRVVLAPVKEKP